VDAILQRFKKSFYQRGMQFNYSPRIVGKMLKDTELNQIQQTDVLSKFSLGLERTNKLINRHSLRNYEH
jgi:hypothetical protein